MMHSDYRLFLILSLIVNSYCRLISLCIYDSPANFDQQLCDRNSEAIKYEYSLLDSSHKINKRESNLTTATPTPQTEELINTTVQAPPLEEKATTVAFEDLSNSTESVEDTTYDPDSRGENDIEDEEFNMTAKYNHHRYYNSYSVAGMELVDQYWVDLDKYPEHTVISSSMLSTTYRRALTVLLSFQFPFYGHTISTVTIATGGFLFTGPHLHKWLAATQYIAPLMANFDPSLSSNATVQYMDNGTSLTVQWDKVTLQDNPVIGPFTFQVTLHVSGKIIFAYKDVPLVVTNIEDQAHPVKVGLSDAYIVEKTVFFVRKKTIYEYHKIDMKKGFEIGNWTAVMFNPLPNCVTLSTCSLCLSEETTFKCEWCQQVGRCSDGMDRHRQHWLEGGCTDNSISNVSYCAFLPPPTTSKPITFNEQKVSSEEQDGLYRQGMVVGLLFFFSIVVVFVGWIIYAYFNPHTSSGQVLIKYRPSAWSWKRGQARYTPATMQSIYM